MKKKALILPIVLCFMLSVLSSCGSSPESSSTEPSSHDSALDSSVLSASTNSSDSSSPVDAQFLSALSSGLTERWTAADSSPDYSSDEEYISDMSSLIQIELSYLDSFRSASFSDSGLSSLAQDYFDALDLSVESLDYFVSNPQKYESMWEDAYNSRCIVIRDLYQNYNLQIPEEHLQTLSEFIDNANLVSPPEFSVGETWVVDDQWELTVTGVTETDDRNQFADSSPSVVYVIDYTYTNTGYVDSSGIMNGLFIGTPEAIVDSSSTVGSEYPGVVPNSPTEAPVGSTCNAQICVGVDNPGPFSFMFSVIDKNGDYKKAKFLISSDDLTLNSSESNPSNTQPILNSSSDSSTPDTSAVEEYAIAGLYNGFGDDCEVVVDGTNIDARFWSDSYTFTAISATAFDSYYEKWSDIKDEFLLLYRTIYDGVESSLPDGYIFSLTMTSSSGHDIPLLSASDDEITYDFVEVHRSENNSSNPTNGGSLGSIQTPDSNLPPFEKLDYSGSGDSVITDVSLPDGAVYYAYISNSGKRNFTVKVYNSSERYDLAVNEIGNYSGFYLFESTDIARIEIHSSGNWKISIAQLTFPDGYSEITSLSGSGPYVSYIFDAPSGTWHFTHDGSSNFVVYSYTTDGTSLPSKGRDLLINEIGSYSGDIYINVPSGKHLVFSIEADGNWTADYTG